MLQKSSQPAPRLLSPDDPAVPAAFAVFENDDVYDGCDQVRDYFAHPQTRLVVWRNPPSFTLPYAETAEEESAIRKSVSALGAEIAQDFQVKSRLRDGWRSFFDPDYDYIDSGMAAHFHDMAALTRLPFERYKDWHDDTHGLIEMLDESFNAREIKLTSRFQAAAQYDLRDAHMPGYLRSNRLRAVRMIAGDPLCFYSEDDVTRRADLRADHRADHKGLRPVSLKDGAQGWTVRPWDIAFISQNTVCQNPVAASGTGMTPRRVMEIFDVTSRDEFIAGAQRPALRAVVRPWLRRWLSGPDDI